MLSFTRTIGAGGQFLLTKLTSALGRIKVNPNLITLLGFVINIVAAFYLAKGQFGIAGTIIFIAGAMDMLDGAVARLTGTATRFGAFFDSVIDRYSDIVLYLGLIIYFGKMPRMTYVVLVGICIMGSMMTSYTRARAESLIDKCKVGFLERPERVVLLILGTWFYRVEHVLWVIAVLSNWTVISRIIFTWMELSKVNILMPITPSFQAENTDEPKHPIEC
ncbi:MAG TPA: CDP-alcohol phosphatidyltransferase family protein [Acidobacteriota bacterium]|nr:CDP-alcohol phosphatidyltransferase family protein [Acidobacteriota bacterium]HOT01248.1 CDP-alcohol phosphatidyltransferase family protein [Acidobacteriota bacterium]HQF87124.1 CDP-alcohol phosphatidyltransferase family protein [Acidobacteriota bacterium]HQG91685.1 CDP-alcohol phosphatidyltransferase family protein [Acidobacteriota bacterium]HQK86676.1 CDP-alcohol phosphatidyltransferase family protein [Acidobacteriota bacterium]